MTSLHSLLLSKWLSLEPLETLYHLPSHLLLFYFIIMLALAKPLFALCQRINLEQVLIRKDNKAVAITFCAYTVGIGIILQSVVHTEYLLNLADLIPTILWSLFGIVLFQFSFWLNQHLFWTVRKHKEILDNENISIACVISGYLIANALIIRSIISGDTISIDFQNILLHPSIQALTSNYSISWLWDILLTILYFILAQVCFFVFSILYQKITTFHLLEQIHENNIAVGIAYSGDIIAIAIILSAPFSVTHSLVFFFAWIILGTALLIALRFILDKLILPSRELNLEIKEDQNWGIALFEAGFSLLYAILLTTLFV